MKAREVHIRKPPTLQYNYKAFSTGLAERVKQLRKERGWTLRDLVVDHGFHLTQISRVESGKGISVPTLLRLAEVFQVPLENLVASLGSANVDKPASKSSKKQPGS